MCIHLGSVLQKIMIMVLRNKRLLTRQYHLLIPGKLHYFLYNCENNTGVDKASVNVSLKKQGKRWGWSGGGRERQNLAVLLFSESNYYIQSRTKLLQKKGNMKLVESR